MIENMLDKINLCLFIKDQHSKLVYCNEAYAERAGLDSPNAGIGRTDFDFRWRENAELYHRGDHLILSGNQWTNVIEPQTLDGEIIHRILVTKNLLIDCNRYYVFGSFQNISDVQIIKKNGYFDKIKKRFYLGELFGKQYLTIQEYRVFRYILTGYTAKRIGVALCLSPKTIESYIENIKIKLNCKTKNDIIFTAISNGLTFILEETL